MSDLPALDGLRLAWLDNAEHDSSGADGARPVVCLHGPGQWSHLYRHLWPLLGARRMLAPDLIGHGRSDKPKRPDWHEPQRHAQVLDQWLDRLQLEPVTLIYHPRMEAMAQALSDSARHPVAAMLPVAPQCMTHANATSWLHAPFPDRGHEAALRAWRLRQVPEEDLETTGASRLAALLLASDAQAAGVG